jgi:hypothetical protein
VDTCEVQLAVAFLVGVTQCVVQFHLTLQTSLQKVRPVNHSVQ